MKALILALVAALAATSGGAQVPLSLDTSFRCTRFFNGELLDNLPLPDGSIVATGYYTYLDNCCTEPYKWWFRIMSNGEIDEAWPAYSASVLIHPFGPYYYFSGMNLPGRSFKIDGERDQSYSVSGSNNPHPDLNYGNNGGIHVQADGGVLFTGDHHIAQQLGPNAPGYYSLMRLNPDATLDSTYHFRKTDGVIWTIVPTTQGRFLLSGVYNTYEGLPEGRIMRIWPDGSLDSSFHTEIIKGYATGLVEQADGRILAAGQFVLQNEPDTMHLIRLLPDGTLDITFHNHTEYDRLPTTSFGGFGFGVGRVQPLADGTMIAVGNFTHIDGQQRRGVALLDSTGHLLNTALNGEGALLTHDFNSTSMYSRINSIGMAPDGSIFLAGVFKGFDDGTVRDSSLTFIVKLHGLSVGIPEKEQPTGKVQVWPNPGHGQVRLDWPGHPVFNLEAQDATGRTVHREVAVRTPFIVDLSRLPKGFYNLLLRTPDGNYAAAKWMKQ